MAMTPFCPAAPLGGQCQPAGIARRVTGRRGDQSWRVGSTRPSLPSAP
ncbi:hypothetical protein ACFFX0_19965 [Citricoccus parietis]|uniref:Uncharacterized protein n=1 Tax=Citricoccus parietis TaxID=592307 RepID=A0ABV5G346_9MICC